jgi:hypothetical protein
MRPTEFEKFVADETEKWGKVVKGIIMSCLRASDDATVVLDRNMRDSLRFPTRITVPQTTAIPSP